MKRITLLLLLALTIVSCQNKYPDLPNGVYAEIITNKGTFVAKLYNEATPLTVANFVSLAQGTNQMVDDKHKGKKFYDSVIFHRVISNFMIQGGGFEPGMSQRATRESIQNEANNGLSNKNGTVAMARTMDPHSASGQFFINVKDNGFLDHTAETMEGWGYAVFGEVVDGMDVVEKIKAVKTTMKAGHQDVPAEDVIIESATKIADAE